MADVPENAPRARENDTEALLDDVVEDGGAVITRTAWRLLRAVRISLIVGSVLEAVVGIFAFAYSLLFKVECDEPLFLFVGLWVLRVLASLGMGFKYRRDHGRPDPNSRRAKVERLLSTVGTGLFVFGNVYLFGSRTCDPVLWWSAAALLAYTWLILALPMLGFLSIAFCLPCCSASLLPYLIQRRGPHTVPAITQEEIDSSLETKVFHAGDDIADTTCCICLDEYVENDVLRALPCNHCFHQPCVDQWLLTSGVCPLCKAAVGVGRAARGGGGGGGGGGDVEMQRVGLDAV